MIFKTNSKFFGQDYTFMSDWNMKKNVEMRSEKENFTLAQNLDLSWNFSILQIILPFMEKVPHFQFQIRWFLQYSLWVTELCCFITSEYFLESILTLIIKKNVLKPLLGVKWPSYWDIGRLLSTFYGSFYVHFSLMTEIHRTSYIKYQKSCVFCGHQDSLSMINWEKWSKKISL